MTTSNQPFLGGGCFVSTSLSRLGSIGNNRNSVAVPNETEGVRETKNHQVADTKRHSAGTEDKDTTCKSVGETKTGKADIQLQEDTAGSGLWYCMEEAPFLAMPSTDSLLTRSIVVDDVVPSKWDKRSSSPAAYMSVLDQDQQQDQQQDQHQNEQFELPPVRTQAELAPRGTWPLVNVTSKTGSMVWCDIKQELMATGMILVSATPYFARFEWYDGRFGCVAMNCSMYRRDEDHAIGIECVRGLTSSETGIWGHMSSTRMLQRILERKGLVQPHDDALSKPACIRPWEAILSASFGTHLTAEQQWACTRQTILCLLGTERHWGAAYRLAKQQAIPLEWALLPDQVLEHCTDLDAALALYDWITSTSPLTDLAVIALDQFLSHLPYYIMSHPLFVFFKQQKDTMTL